ncbi:hypothetical protein [Enterobacter mori]|uniref:hypothetical protein n=1 Tax=Enterobacter mori TaxID=539813 RepID=UPI003B83E93E
MNVQAAIKFFVFFVFMIMLVRNAWADWSVHTEDDAFGKDAVVTLHGNFGDISDILFECKSKQLTAHYLEKNIYSDPERSGIIAQEMAIKIDNNPPVIFNDVQLYRRNHNYISVRSFDTDKIKASLALLKVSKVGVVAGVKLKSGVKVSASGDFHNAEKAVKKFIRQCGITL